MCEIPGKLNDSSEPPIVDMTNFWKDKFISDLFTESKTLDKSVERLISKQTLFKDP